MGLFKRSAEKTHEARDRAFDDYVNTVGGLSLLAAMVIRFGQMNGVTTTLPRTAVASSTVAR